MYCIFCKHKDTEVIETRLAEEGSAVRRRRNCTACGRRFTTYERAEEITMLIVKRDGRREAFDREKLRLGITKSVGKTKVTALEVDEIIRLVASKIFESESHEVTSEKIGQWVSDELKKIDKIAYIRFSSVFKRFVDIDEFEKELKKLT